MISKKYLEELMKVAGEGTPVLHGKDHKIPKTRRELVGQGLALGSTFIAVPSIIDLAFDYLGANRAYGVEAAQCSKAAAGATKPPAFLQIEAAGGCMMAGDFVFGKQPAGAPVEFLADAGYSTIGWDATANPKVMAPNMAFGAPFHVGSPLLAGMLSVMSPAAVAKTAVVGQANATGDDTANNQLGSTHLAIKAVGPSGQLVQIAGTSASPNGGRSAVNPLGQDPGLSKALVASPASLTALVDQGVLGQLLGGNPGAEKVSKAALAMTEKKLAMFKAKDLNGQVQTLVACGYLGSTDVLTKFTAAALDPTTDPRITGLTTSGVIGQVAAPLFAATAVSYRGAPVTINTLTPALQQRNASIIKLLVDGNASAAAIEMAGYDYHAQGLATTNAKQMALGVAIGQALELAHRAVPPRPMFIAVTTDGATSAGGAATLGQTSPQADSGSRGASMMFAIGATARPLMNFNQIGAFSDAGSVNAAEGIQAASAGNASTVIAANFAQFAGKLDNMKKAVALPGALLADETKYIAFKKPA